MAALAAALAAAAAAPAFAGRPRLTASALECEACVLIDDRGRVLFARAARRLLPNASTTKIVTAMAVTSSADLDETVQVSGAAAATPGGGLSLEAGDTASVRDLLHALLLTSSNDAAVALAEHVAGGEAAFVGKMNDLARRFGAHRTRFVTAHGLDAPGHYSTAGDLARLGAKMLEDPLLASIVRRRRARIEVDGHPVVLENGNPLLETYPGAVGIKTGMTAEAGTVLVAAARRHGRTLVAVAMRSPDAAADNRLMLDYGFALLARTVVLAADRPVAALIFSSGATPVRPARDLRGLSSRPAPAPTLDADVRAPLAAGQVVGEVRVGAGGRARIPAVAMRDVERARVPWPVAIVTGLLRVVATLVGRAG